MKQTAAGPVVALTNEQAGSDGDIFSHGFKLMGIGTLVGTRTWGGLIGISGNTGLVDGGTVTAPTFRFMDKDGNWAVENEGVSPDIEVIDTPHLVAQGHDPSLEKAVEEVLKELDQHPVKTITAPPAPTDIGKPGEPLN